MGVIPSTRCYSVSSCKLGLASRSVTFWQSLNRRAIGSRVELRNAVRGALKAMLVTRLP
jgi:hypothetical protein